MGTASGEVARISGGEVVNRGQRHAGRVRFVQHGTNAEDTSVYSGGDDGRVFSDDRLLWKHTGGVCAGVMTPHGLLTSGADARARLGTADLKKPASKKFGSRPLTALALLEDGRVVMAATGGWLRVLSLPALTVERDFRFQAAGSVIALAALEAGEFFALTLHGTSCWDLSFEEWQAERTASYQELQSSINREWTACAGGAAGLMYATEGGVEWADKGFLPSEPLPSAIAGVERQIFLGTPQGEVRAFEYQG
ncbi:MAG: hypothetical protein H6718_34915 [Polyangiaceae bacterium]|nr:hypothetical protein [Polyangiaceae bacterium]